MKKIIALALCLASMMVIFCSCKPKTPATSSTPTENESSMFEDETNSGYSENESSSIADEEEPWDEEEEPWDEEEEPWDEEEEPWDEEESSKNYKPINRNPSIPQATTSSSIKLPDIDGSTMEIGCYQFSPVYTNNYTNKYTAINNGGGSVEANIQEFEDVLSLGYFNTVFLEPNMAANEIVWQVVEKYKVKVWIISAGIFKISEGKTIEEQYKGSSWEKAVNFIKQSDKRWKLFNGFAYDEIIHRGNTNEDFGATMEYIYKVVGKRNFPVMAPQDFTTLWAIAGHGKQSTECCKYVTDISFDMYTGDVREGAQKNFVITDAQNAYPEYNIKDAKDVYRMMSNEMLKLVAHPVTAWYYPSAQYLGHDDEEGYCLAQLKFFEELLKEQDHPGGMILYTYPQPNDTRYGMQSYLDMGPYAEKTIRRYENQVWKEYSAYLKDLTMRYRNTKNNPTIDLGV